MRRFASGVAAMRCALGAASVLVSCVALATSADAQQRDRSSFSTGGESSAPWLALGVLCPPTDLRCVSAASPPPSHRALVTLGDSTSGSYWSVLASAMLPGSGQALLGQRRFIPYVAFEALAWTRFSHHRSDFRAARSRYERLASDIARAPFSTSRPTGDFAYYENMQQYPASGAYDLSADPLLDPETDESTFNGATWLLARRTYWDDANVAPDRDSPAWVRAERFYRGRAIRPPFRWSWLGAATDYDRFRRTIRASNEANKDAVLLLGLILANHALSTVDAFVTVRLRRRGAHDVPRYEVTAELPFGTR